MYKGQYILCDLYWDLNTWVLLQFLKDYASVISSCTQNRIYFYYKKYKYQSFISWYIDFLESQWINPLYLIHFWNYILCTQKSFTKELTRYHNYEGLLFIHFILHFVLPLHFLCRLTCKLFIYVRFYSFVIYFYVPYKSGYVSNCQKQKSCNN